MSGNTCAFCAIVRGDLAARLVLEDEHTMAFLDRRPLFRGHALVVPRVHCATLADLPGDLLRPLFASAQIVARAMEDALGAEGTFVAINNRVSQSVPHLHIHIVPRRSGDGLKGFFWPRQRYADEQEMEAMADRLRGAIAGLSQG